MLRRFCRSLGWIVTALGLIALGADLLASLAAGGLTAASLGERWFALAPTSLQLAQPAIQRYLLPELWDPVILTLLLAPASLVLIATGLAVRWLAGLGAPSKRGRAG